MPSLEGVQRVDIELDYITTSSTPHTSPPTTVSPEMPPFTDEVEEPEIAPFVEMIDEEDSGEMPEGEARGTGEQS